MSIATIMLAVAMIPMHVTSKLAFLIIAFSAFALVTWLLMFKLNKGVLVNAFLKGVCFK
jgi:hypothetical protein